MTLNGYRFINNMKKNKSTIGENIINGLIVILALIGLCVIATWAVDGVMHVVKTYNQVNELSNKVVWLEDDIKVITKQLCPGYANPILRNGKCVHSGFGYGYTFPVTVIK
jgi:hypothetical protein